MRKGILSFEKGHWREALACFDAATQLRPRRNEVHNFRALTCERLGRLGDALECLDRAVAIDPSNLADLRNRGMVLRLIFAEHAQQLPTSRRCF